MVFLRIVVRAGALLVLGASLLQAQGTRVIVAPQGQPRIASIAPPPPPPRPSPDYQFGQTIYGNVPAIITPDGRVLVNLGYGYEQVARTCPYAYGYGCQSYGYPLAPQTPIFGPYGPPNYVPPTYAPPAYAAPRYPAPTTYPPTSYQPPGYPPPAVPTGGCPPGYIATGANPPCIDPARSPSTPLTLPAPQSAPAAVRAAPHRAAAGTSTAPVVVRRR